jgi:hypothetical protein
MVRLVNELEGMLKEAVWPVLRYYTNICLEALRNAEVLIPVVDIPTEFLTGNSRIQTELPLNTNPRCRL